jgi:hypothetical protein
MLEIASKAQGNCGDFRQNGSIVSGLAQAWDKLVDSRATGAIPL